MGFLSDPFESISSGMSSFSDYFVDPKSLICKDPAADHDITQKVKNDINKATANVPSSNSVAKCPLLGNTDTPSPVTDPNNKKCNFNSLKISKPGRSFDLIINQATTQDNRTLAVISGFKNEPAKVYAELQGPVGPCPEIHNEKRSFNTGGSTLKILPETTDDKLAIEVTSVSNIKIFPWGVITNKFPVIASRCGHSGESATIEVFPDTEADVTLTWNFGEKETRDDERDKVDIKNPGKAILKKNQSIEKHTSTKTQTVEISKGLEISGSLKYDGKDQDLQISFNKTIETLKQIDSIVKTAHKALSAIKQAQEVADESLIFDNPVSFGLKLPNIGIGLGGSWIEDKGKPTVSYKGTISILADPIIGLFFEWNITETVLQSVPVGFVLTSVLNRLKLHLLELVIKVGAEVAGNVEIDIINLKIQNVTGKITGKIPVSAELTAIKFDVNVYFAHATIEAMIGVDSGLFISFTYESDDELFYCKGGFLNFVVWVSGKLELGLAEDDTDTNSYQSKTQNNQESAVGPEAKYVLYEKDFEDSAKELFRYDFKQQ